jgi:hypothetical protein
VARYRGASTGAGTSPAFAGQRPAPRSTRCAGWRGPTGSRCCAGARTSGAAIARCSVTCSGGIAGASEPGIGVTALLTAVATATVRERGQRLRHLPALMRPPARGETRCQVAAEGEACSGARRAVHDRLGDETLVVLFQGARCPRSTRGTWHAPLARRYAREHRPPPAGVRHPREAGVRSLRSRTRLRGPGGQVACRTWTRRPVSPLDSRGARPSGPRPVRPRRQMLARSLVAVPSARPMTRSGRAPRRRPLPAGRPGDGASPAGDEPGVRSHPAPAPPSTPTPGSASLSPSAQTALSPSVLKVRRRSARSATRTPSTRRHPRRERARRLPGGWGARWPRSRSRWCSGRPRRGDQCSSSPASRIRASSPGFGKERRSSDSSSPSSR